MRNKRIFKLLKYKIPKRSLKNHQSIPTKTIANIPPTQYEEQTLNQILSNQSNWKGKNLNGLIPKSKKSSFDLASVGRLVNLSDDDRLIASISLLSQNSKQKKFLDETTTPKRKTGITKKNVSKTTLIRNTISTRSPALLQNGTSSCDYFNNTCAFDSLIQCLAIAYSKVHRELIYPGSEDRCQQLIYYLFEHDFKNMY